MVSWGEQGVELGHWPVLDRILREAEQLSNIQRDTRAQANLLYALSNPAHGYWEIAPENQQALLSRTMALVPRLNQAKHPKTTLEAMFRLWLVPDPFEALSRAVKVGEFEPRPPQEEESIYPTDGFTGWFMTWARECDVPIAFLFWAAVSALGAACRYNFFIDRGTEPMRLNHYCLFIGEKGTGKSTGLDACCEVLRHLNGQAWGWKPGKPLPNLRETHPFHVRMLPEDTNQETLIRALAPQIVPLSNFVETKTSMMRDPHVTESTGLLALDELTTFLGHGNWAVEKRVPWLNRIIADKPYTYHTQKGGVITLTELAISLLACCPPDIMQSAVSPLLFQGGFLDRSVVVYRDPVPAEERMFPTPRPRDPLGAAQLGRFLLPLSARFHREELLATPEGLDWYNDWYKEQRDPEDVRMQSIARRGNQVWKLAGVLAMADESCPWIGLKHFMAASRVLKNEAFHYTKLLGLLEQTPDSQLMDHIEQVLLRHKAYGDQWMTRSELFQILRTKKGLSPPTVKALPLIQSLEASDRIDVRVGTTPNRKNEAYRLTRPALVDLRQRSPSGLRALPAPGQLADLHQPDIEAQELEPADTGQEPEPELEQA